MKPKIKLLFAIILCSISSVLNAQSVNINTAKAIARHHLAAISGPSLKSTGSKGKNFQFTSVKATVANNDTLYYILNDTINKGFVIVSADKRAWPILGYSTEGSYNEKKQPEAFTAWMENRKKEIQSIKYNNLQSDSITTASWQNLSLKNAAIETASVEPLVLTQWDQGCYYNSMCPADAAGPCGHAVTGCVATSMAQIMKYWNYPTKGKGSHSYQCAGYGILQADFGATTYQWSQMSDQVTSENEAVAKLMLHCGISVDMRYGSGSSGSYDPRDELVEYFNYSPEAENIDRRSYSENDWLNLLKTELDHGRLVWYQGTTSPCNGVTHAFVCDGYQNSDYFHFNWGWGGNYDGYFYLGNLNPGSDSFSALQSAIIKIFPNSLPDGYTGFLLSTKTVGIGYNGGTAKIKINSSIEWKATFDQSWLAVTPEMGTTSTNTITFSASTNPTTNNRTANVILSAPGLASQTITVTQYGRFEVTSGNLKTVLSSQLSSITNLTLSGTIDARDFKTMRDEMPELTDIDLSDVVIAAYSGFDGTIPEKFTYSANEIPRLAFRMVEVSLSKTRLKSIVFPPSITSIDDYAFMGCKNLTIDGIPAGITSIGDNAFSECNCSTALTIAASVTFIGKWAFQCFNGPLNVDKDNPNYSSIDGVLFNKSQTELIQCPVSKGGNYTIPPSVATLGLYAFDHCAKLTAITVPSSVTSIQEGAFSYCTGLTTLNIPSSVTSIGLRPFSCCSGHLFIDDKNPNYSATDGVFFNKGQTELISCPVWKTGTYTIPPTVTKISDEAFYHCDNISSIIVPSGVKSIGTFSFNCVGLSSLYVYPVSPVDLSSVSFVFNEYTTSACNLYVRYGTKSLYEASIQWLNFIHIVEIKQTGIFLSNTTASIRKKGGSAVINISSSEDWSASSDQAWLTINPPTGYSNSNTITFTAAANPGTSMRKATVTILATGLASQTIEVLQYGNIVVTAGNLKSILFDQLSATDLTLTGTIDARDFKTMRDDLPALTEINLSDVTIEAYTGTQGTMGNYNITYPANKIPSYAFFKTNPNDGKYSLKSIIFPQSVNSVGSFAFGKCTGINSFNIFSSVTSIEDQAFYYCKGLMDVETDNPNYSSQEGGLFNKNKTTLIRFPSLKAGSYTIPSSVETIDEYAFAQCDSLTSITIPSSVTTIGSEAFGNCYSLESINIPSSVTSIRAGLFEYCKNLKSINIPSSVVSIGGGAFLGCFGLNSIKAYSQLPIDLIHSTDVFSGVNLNTCTLYVPYGTAILYRTANLWKDFANIVEMPDLTLSALETKVAAKANSTTSVTIKGNVAWTAASDQAWLTIDKASGSGDQTLTFTAQENTSLERRTATVTILAGNVPQTITITQEAKNTTGTDQLSINPEFKVYPNPTTGKLKLVFDQIPLSGILITINDITGKNCLKQLIHEKESWIDLSGNVPGIYIIRTDQENFKAQKLILK